ncbi:hypothetical protein L1987_79123 [Smallanthus sonchifolius]|uniref:Uncharacterized protein n=1 Tax=Smallanthus sonchifolius TaxID=185202 RepID=A0ACB8ZFK9_9ASTR|nr:hypothetical protein L1987_79123 [Smallanthus sonchifolius]
MMAPWICYYCLSLFLILNCYSTTAQPPFDYPSANLSTTWTNNESLPHSLPYTDGSQIRAILLRGSFGPKFACGFYCNGTCTSYLFAVFIVQTNSGGGIVQTSIGFPQVVWSANRDHPVSYGATLNLTATGELVLQDADGSTVWTTNTTGKSVAGLNLTDDGNLVLFDVNSLVVWQSFEYPTDCLVPGQRLFQGQQLIPSVSSTNWTAQKDLFSLQVTNEGLFAYVTSNPPQVYYDNLRYRNNTNTGRRYIRFLNGSLSLFTLSDEPSDPFELFPIPIASSAQYLKLTPDGHLQVFEWQGSWLVVDDLFNGYLGECNYPMACGRNGLCSGNQQCSCPVSSSPRIDYFRAVNDRQPNLGCSAVTPLICNATQDQTFIALENVMYFSINADMESVDIETCKQACFLVYVIRKRRRDAQMEEESIGEVNKSFLAEVQSIGSIHHVNLVRLRGFGAWKSQRFLVYEFMSNGKNFDRSQPEESWHLLAVLQKCWEQGMLLDMVDMYSEDMQTHSLEVVEMMKVASWCLQYDFTKRPSMSTVVKVLEGVMKVESRLDYNFTDPRQQNTAVEHDQDMTPLMASVLSGPRETRKFCNTRSGTPYLFFNSICDSISAITIFRVANHYTGPLLQKSNNTDKAQWFDQNTFGRLFQLMELEPYKTRTMGQLIKSPKHAATTTLETHKISQQFNRYVRLVRELDLAEVELDNAGINYEFEANDMQETKTPVTKPNGVTLFAPLMDSMPE